MIEVGEFIMCGICFAANAYMAIKTRQALLRTAALLTAALCVATICLNAFVISLR